MDNFEKTLMEKKRKKDRERIINYTIFIILVFIIYGLMLYSCFKLTRA